VLERDDDDEAGTIETDFWKSKKKGGVGIQTSLIFKNKQGEISFFFFTLFFSLFF
jgi:hypothetical protein